MTKSEQDEKDLQRAVNAYHRVFVGPEWEIVHQDLQHRFRTKGSAFSPGPNGVCDPYLAAHRDGARSMMEHIDFMLTLKVIGDANVEQPSVTIKK